MKGHTRPGPCSGGGLCSPLLGPCPRALLLCSLVVAGLQVQGCRANFFTRIFVPLCPLLAEPPLAGFLRWSDPSTWQRTGLQFTAGSSRAASLGQSWVPGLGAAVGANVSVPCGVALLLDVPRVVLTVLDVQGLLRVEDPAPVLRRYTVEASFVTVEGRLAAGTAAQSFRSSLVFLLLPNPRARLPLRVRGLAYPDKFNREHAAVDYADVGHKAFAIVGGQVDFHGMPGGSQTPSWLKLAATVRPGDSSLQVDGVCGVWPLGAAIAVASSDFFRNHSESRVITAYGAGSAVSCVLRVDRPFEWEHWGDAQGIPDGFGGYVDERAEVGLLTRNIVVAGEPEVAPFDLEGGHFIVFQTQTPQFIEGVEFFQLGQQGNLGRYPLHFHVCGDTQGRSTVRNNAVHQSRQRCVVIHATHNVTVSGTVTYDTFGHCFMLEEGGEQDNVFSENLGMFSHNPQKLISPFDSDSAPTMFWFKNLKNDFIDNVATGAANSGFWPEVGLRGMSLFIPELANLTTRDLVGARFEGNVAHSNGIMGFRTYPTGIRGYTYSRQAGYFLYETVLRGFRVYKNPIGVFFLGSENVTLVDSVVADNLVGILDRNNVGGAVRDTLILGHSDTAGSPPPCFLCAAPEVSVGFDFGFNETQAVYGIFGVVLFGGSYGWARSSTRFSNCSFSKFQSPSSALPSAAFAAGLGLGPSQWWPASSAALQGSRLEPGSAPAWFPTPSMVARKGSLMGTDDLVIWDQDGGFVGGGGGVLAAPNPALLPIGADAALCSPAPGLTAYSCPGVCYRTLLLSYDEGAFGRRNPKRTYSTGDFSYLEVSREGSVLRSNNLGNLNSATVGTQRQFYVTLLADHGAYTVAVKPPLHGSPGFWPSNITLQFADNYLGGNCNGVVRLRLLGRYQASLEGQASRGVGGTTAAGVQQTPPWSWVLEPAPFSFTSPCPGVLSGGAAKWPVRIQEACYGGVYRAAILRLDASLTFRTYVVLQASSRPPRLCSLPLLCGVIPPGSTYFSQVRANAEGIVGFQSLEYMVWATWPQLPAPIGFDYTNTGPVLRSPRGLPPGGVLTHYYRTAFNLSAPSCVSGIGIQYFPNFGLVVYLNGEEVFRWDLPEGEVNATTPALEPKPSNPGVYMLSTEVAFVPPGLWEVNETNFLAYEVHAINAKSPSLYFDSQVLLQYRCGVEV